MERLKLEANRGTAGSDTEIGEFRIDIEGESTSECLMLMRDTEGKRVSLKVSLGEVDISRGFKQGIITENEKKAELKLRTIITDTMACVPKNYKVGESAKTGFFRDEQVMISKVDIGLHEQMKPFVYELRGEGEQNNSDSDENNFGGFIDPKRKRKGGSLVDHQKHNRRVTMSKSDLECAVFSLFQEKKEYKIGEMESRLNHPRATLKAALKHLCYYDFSRKVYTLKMNH